MDQRFFIQRSSGDLLADQRYAYARAAAEDGDYAAAADLFEQTLELVPDWPAAWFALGEAFEKLKNRDKAVEAFTRALAIDPADELGAALHLARLGAQKTPRAASDNYVRSLFDQYAERFDTHLTEKLAYRAPALLADAVAGLNKAPFDHVIDLGCGTGLCGAAFRGDARLLTGVDLSSRMIETARAKGLYDRLEVQNLVPFLDAEPQESASLLLAADVLVYIGDLAPLFAVAASVLARGGLFAFTVQRGEGGYMLGPDVRYAHAPIYVAATAAAMGFRTVHLDTASTRKDAGRDVPGLVVVVERV
jgi:predicted TPR repeat methyltransferase